MDNIIEAVSFKTKRASHTCPGCGQIWIIHRNPHDRSEIILPDTICPECCPSAYKNDGTKLVYTAMPNGSKGFGLVKSANDY